MPWPRGKPRGKVPGSGKKKGTPNKLSQDISAKLRRLQCDPLTGMVRLVQDDNTDASIKARLYMELAQYVYPKRKAIDPETAVPLQQAQMLMQQYLQLFQTVILRHVTDSSITTAIFTDFAQGVERIIPHSQGNGTAVHPE